MNVDKFSSPLKLKIGAERCCDEADSSIMSLKFTFFSNLHLLPFNHLLCIVCFFKTSFAMNIRTGKKNARTTENLQVEAFKNNSFEMHEKSCREEEEE